MSDEPLPKLPQKKVYSGRGGRRSTTWGQPGVPPPKSRGRPRLPEEFKEAVRSAAPKALETLLACLDEGGTVALGAARAILDRAYGCAAQEITNKLVTDAITDEERIARLTEVLAGRVQKDAPGPVVAVPESGEPH